MSQVKDTPAYVRIAEDIRARIRRGDPPPGGMLPSEADLIRRYSVARGTVRQALAELEREGLVVSQTGRGRKVCGESLKEAPPSTRYEDVAHQLRKDINGGEFAPGVRLPGEPALAQRFQAARVTVRKALEILQHEGLIIAIPSKGRFVADQSPRQSGED
ncbi:GntR family transcriptional regulator [Nonomuraea typhae]|uniref:GntR family transcriptional regulator n=1 Tax=Nonomuraea typhae TaxID=2603600 RepID=UPI0012FC7AB6